MENINEILKNDETTRKIAMKATNPPPRAVRGNVEGGVTPTRSEMQNITSSRIRNIRNAEKIQQALPEIETIATISVSALLSTKDLVTTSLVYDCVNDEIPLELKNKYIATIRDFFDNVDKLPTNLYNWLFEAQKSKGATPIMFVSDEGFNSMFGLTSKVAQESVKKQFDIAKKSMDTQKGYLYKFERDNKTLALENIINTGNLLSEPQKVNIDYTSLFDKGIEHKFDIEFTDNPAVLFKGELRKKLVTEAARRGGRENLSSTYKRALDDFINDGNTKPIEQQDNTIKAKDLITPKDLNPGYDDNPTIHTYAEVPSANTPVRNVLEPIKKKIPAESLFAVSLSGEETDPLGYLIILDELGNPISSKSSMYGNIALNDLVNQEGVASNIIDRSSSALGNSVLTPEIAQRLMNRYSELAESKLLEAISNGLGGGDISISAIEEFTTINFSRHLAKRHTQVLYVPAENLAYFAINYNEDGIGVSIAEKSFVISSIRMVLLFASMNTAILNSSRNMQFDIDLAPEDRNAQETIDRVKTDIINAYARPMPAWGNFDDVYSMATNAGLAFNVNGNDFYASHKVSVSDTTPDYKMPDEDFDTALLRRTCNIANVDPDLVLTPENIEFASQIFSKSLITTQQVTKKQEQLSKPISRYVTTYTLSSPRILDLLTKDTFDYIREIGGERASELKDVAQRYLELFVNNIKVTIPPPDTSTAEAQMEQYDKRAEFIEKLVDTIFTEDVKNSLNNAGMSLDADTIKEAFKSYYIRKWCVRNGIESDMFDMIFDKDKQKETIKAMVDDGEMQAKALARLGNNLSKRFETATKNIIKGDGEDYSSNTPADDNGYEDDDDFEDDSIDDTEETDDNDLDNAEESDDDTDTEVELEDDDSDVFADEEPDENGMTE